MADGAKGDGPCSWIGQEGLYLWAVRKGYCPDPTPDPVAVNMVYYGNHNPRVDSRIIWAKPEILICNTPAGAWHGACTSSKFQAFGIKVFSYIAGGWEATIRTDSRVPITAAENVKLIRAIADEETHGVFLDEVSAYPTPEGHEYLKIVSKAARSRGLELICNTGVTEWDPSLSLYCDHVNGSEVYNGALSDWSAPAATPVMMLSQNVISGKQAAAYTEAAWAEGIAYHYSTEDYQDLPTWLEDYFERLRR